MRLSAAPPLSRQLLRSRACEPGTGCLMIRAAHFMVSEMRFFFSSTLSTRTLTMSPTLTASDG